MMDVIADLGVRAAFAAHPRALASALLDLRRLILRAGDGALGEGALIETLKWGEPAYLPKAVRTGTTVRINAVKGSQTKYGAYFHCQTSLIDSFRSLYAGHFAFDGNRALIFELGAPVPPAEFEHCVAMALTYHRDRRAAV